MVSCTNIAAFGDERRVGPGVAQLATNIAALAASKALIGQVGSGIVELLSGLVLGSSAARLAAGDVLVRGTATALQFVIDFQLVAHDSAIANAADDYLRTDNQDGG